MKDLEERFSYFPFLKKLCDDDYTQRELNIFIERIFKIAYSYIHYRYSQIKKIIDSNLITSQDFAIDAIAPLFQNKSDTDNFILVEEINKWEPPIKNEPEAVFFLNKVISRRVEQHISILLRESDPFFSRILDSINYIIRTQGYQKVNYIGKIFITESVHSDVISNTISPEEFKKLSPGLFSDRKTFLKMIFEYLKNETDYYPAIPLNELIFRIKGRNIAEYVFEEKKENIIEKLEVNEIINSGLSFVKDKLNKSYLKTGKLNQEEYNNFCDALRAMANDLRDGGINPGLYYYLSPYFNNLSLEKYNQKYHNKFEYLAKLLKEKIANELGLK